MGMWFVGEVMGREDGRGRGCDESMVEQALLLQCTVVSLELCCMTRCNNGLVLLLSRVLVQLLVTLVLSGSGLWAVTPETVSAGMTRRIVFADIGSTRVFYSHAYDSLGRPISWNTYACASTIRTWLIHPDFALRYQFPLPYCPIPQYFAVLRPPFPPLRHTALPSLAIRYPFLHPP